VQLALFTRTYGCVVNDRVRHDGRRTPSTANLLTCRRLLQCKRFLSGASTNVAALQCVLRKLQDHVVARPARRYSDTVHTELTTETGFVLINLLHVDVPRTPSTANLLTCRRYNVRRAVSAKTLCDSIVYNTASTNKPPRKNTRHCATGKTLRRYSAY